MKVAQLQRFLNRCRGDREIYLEIGNGSDYALIKPNCYYKHESASSSNGLTPIVISTRRVKPSTKKKDDSRWAIQPYKLYQKPMEVKCSDMT